MINKIGENDINPLIKYPRKTIYPLKFHNRPEEYYISISADAKLCQQEGDHRIAEFPLENYGFVCQQLSPAIEHFTRLSHYYLPIDYSASQPRNISLINHHSLCRFFSLTYSTFPFPSLLCESIIPVDQPLYICRRKIGGHYIYLARKLFRINMS